MDFGAELLECGVLGGGVGEVGVDGAGFGFELYGDGDELALSDAEFGDAGAVGGAVALDVGAGLEVLGGLGGADEGGDDVFSHGCGDVVGVGGDLGAMRGAGSAGLELCRDNRAYFSPKINPQF